MEGRFDRTEMLLGGEAMERLGSARVAVFGIGGVGGYAVEALARSGVGALDLVDSDRVCLSNLNRQIIATEETLGMYKVDAAEARIRSINPGCTVRTYRMFFLPENEETFDFGSYDYVIDAIDTVSGKLALIEKAVKAGTPVISSMGAGNKLDPAAFRVADIYSTSVCPLARVMRRELKKRGIGALKVVYSEEPPMTPRVLPGADTEENTETLPESMGNAEAEHPETGVHRRRSTPGSVAFVPSAAGLILAGEVIRDLCRIR